MNETVEILVQSRSKSCATCVTRKTKVGILNILHAQPSVPRRLLNYHSVIRLVQRARNVFGEDGNARVTSKYGRKEVSKAGNLVLVVGHILLLIPNSRYI
jgi:hypothetical protein